MQRLTVKSLRSFFLLHPFVFFLSPSILLQKTCFLHQCNLKFSILSLRKTFVCLYGRDAAVTMRRNTLWRIQSTMDREVNVKKIWYTWKPLKYVQLYVKIYQTKCYLLSYSTYNFRATFYNSCIWRNIEFEITCYWLLDS